MPFITRDASGKIIRATTQPMPGAEAVPYDHPDLVAFVSVNGQDPAKIDEALAELRRTDADMSRAVEDVVMALLKKNVLKMTDLPKAVQEKMARRVKLRVMIQECYDRASGNTGNAGPLTLPPSSSGFGH